MSRGLGIQLVRFCLIGGIGFLADAAVLLVLIDDLGLQPLAARLASFTGAVLVTFELNRRWTFRMTGGATYLSKLATYVGVQSVGFLCNFAVYAGVYSALRPAPAAPLIALAIASIAALFLNYIGAKTVVFKSRPTSTDGHAPD